MANLTSAINIQVDSDTKKQATDILNNLGLSMSTAINIFLKQVIKRDGIPFEIVNNKPNEEMLKVDGFGKDNKNTNYIATKNIETKLSNEQIVEGLKKYAK